MEEWATLKLDLLGKTELRIENVELRNADLNEFATVVAEVLGLTGEEVMVTDVRENSIVVDILRREVYAENIYGKRKELLRRLSALQGISLSEKTSIHSEGVLGFIALDEKEAEQVIERTKKIEEDIKEKMVKRAIVFSTGFEVQKAAIKDNNTPMIAARLEKEGYTVTIGRTLEDDEHNIAMSISRSIDRGYGLVITTGGVGAENKDRTVEGILQIDPEAATPYVTMYHKGTGRHEKEGVRIAVGKVGNTTIIALPGPNQEAKLGIDVAIDAIKANLDKKGIATNIAQALRQNLKTKMNRA